MKIETFIMDHYQDVITLWKKAGISVGSSDSEQEIEKVLQRNPSLFLVGKKESRIISVVIGGYDGRRGYVHHLAVDPEFQRMGYGEKLMEELMNRFREMKVHKIHLFIEKDNKNVVNFYQHHGWEVRNDLIMMSFISNNDLYKRKL